MDIIFSNNNFYLMSKIKRCTACKRTLQSAINEHKKSGAACNQEGCVFTNEINSALGIKKIIRISPANKQNVDKKIIKIKPRTRQDTTRTRENVDIDFSDNGELAGEPDIHLVLEWIKGRIEYSNHNCDFVYDINENRCRCKFVINRHSYRNNPEPYQEYVFHLSDLLEIVNPNSYRGSYGRAGYKNEGSIELVAFGGKNILYREYNDGYSENAIEWLSNIVGKKPKYQKVASFNLYFANNSAHPYDEMISILNYVIRFFGGGKNIR
jgi:hypothetical protein